MNNGHIKIYITKEGEFYSKLYNLNKHPNYLDLYESWSNNQEKLYNHKRELEYEENGDYRLLHDIGLIFAKPIEKLKIEKVNKDDIKDLTKYGVIQLEDLKINN